MWEIRHPFRVFKTIFRVWRSGHVESSGWYSLAIPVSQSLKNLSLNLRKKGPSSSVNTRLIRPSTITNLSLSAREPLIQALKHIIELSHCRIESGELSIKGPLFCSAVVAQITAMEAREPPHQATFEAVKQSAETCYRLLCARNPSTSAESDQQHYSDGQSGFSPGMEEDFGFDNLVKVGLSFLTLPSYSNLETCRYKTRIYILISFHGKLWAKKKIFGKRTFRPVVYRYHGPVYAIHFPACHISSNLNRNVANGCALILETRIVLLRWSLRSRQQPHRTQAPSLQAIPRPKRQ
jgi:hypothetical protein